MKTLLTIATGLSLVAIVIGRLTSAYGKGHSKKTLAGMIFGVGMAIGTVNFTAVDVPVSSSRFESRAAWVRFLESLD
jgi:hypothetical protein